MTLELSTPAACGMFFNMHRNQIECAAFLAFFFLLPHFFITCFPIFLFFLFLLHRQRFAYRRKRPKSAPYECLLLRCEVHFFLAGFFPRGGSVEYFWEW